MKRDEQQGWQCGEKVCYRKHSDTDSQQDTFALPGLPPLPSRPCPPPSSIPLTYNQKWILHVSAGNGLSPPFCTPAPIQRGFWLEAKRPDLHTCGTEDGGGRGVGRAREMERRSAWLRKAERKKLFFTLVLNWFCCLLPSNRSPLRKGTLSRLKYH